MVVCLRESRGSGGECRDKKERVEKQQVNRGQLSEIRKQRKHGEKADKGAFPCEQTEKQNTSDYRK